MQEDVFGAFYATDDVFGTASVNVIECDEDNSSLYTADSMGWVKQWDIRNYCMSGEDNKRPPCITAWQAHRAAITKMIINEECKFLITARCSSLSISQHSLVTKARCS